MRLTEKHIECAHLCARLEDREARTRKLWPENVVLLVWPKKPVPRPNSALTCPIFRSRTAGNANGRLDIEDPEPAQLRELLPEVRRGK